MAKPGTRVGPTTGVVTMVLTVIAWRSVSARASEMTCPALSPRPATATTSNPDGVGRMSA